MDDSKKVRVFFNKEARRFDAYYLDEKKPIFWKILDFIFRRSIYARLELALEECKMGKAIKVLDVGCGSGRCAARIARQGRATITGIDFSSEMVKIAKEIAEEYRVQDRCCFILGDFRDIALDEKFDVCIALGFFDYTKNPREYLRKMKSVTTGKIIASFPLKWKLRNIVRIVRMKVLGCPVYFYTEKKIKKIFTDSALSDYTIRCIGRDYFVVAWLS